LPHGDDLHAVVADPKRVSEVELRHLADKVHWLARADVARDPHAHSGGFLYGRDTGLERDPELHVEGAVSVPMDQRRVQLLSPLKGGAHVGRREAGQSGDRLDRPLLYALLLLHDERTEHLALLWLQV